MKLNLKFYIVICLLSLLGHAQEPLPDNPKIGLVLSALQLGVIKNKKFIIFNHKNYWSDLIKQYQKTIVQGFAYKSFGSYFKICKNLSELKKIY